MKSVSMALACMLAALLVTAGGVFAAEQSGGKQEMGMREVYAFIKNCEHYFLATMDGDQPRVRPFGTLAIFEGRIYFQTGKVKDVSGQIGQNPRIELCAYDGKGQWVRVQAVAVNDDRREVKQFLLDAHPGLEKMYSADDGNTQALYLKDVKARFYSSSGEPRLVEF